MTNSASPAITKHFRRLWADMRLGAGFSMSKHHTFAGSPTITIWMYWLPLTKCHASIDCHCLYNTIAKQRKYGHICRYNKICPERARDRYGLFFFFYQQSAFKQPTAYTRISGHRQQTGRYRRADRWSFSIVRCEYIWFIVVGCELDA